MVTVKNALAGAAVAAGATVALVASAVPAAATAYLSTCGGRQTDPLVCISNQQRVASLFAVPQAETANLHLADVVAYVAVYRVPNSSVGVPCVVASVNATTSDECASLGLVRDETTQPIALVNGPVDGVTPTISAVPLAVVDVCTGILNANYHGIGINDQPIVTVCVGSDALTTVH